MPRDLIAEQALIDVSRTQRQAWDRLLLLTAGLPEQEADRIAALAAADREEMQEIRHAA